MNANDPMEIQVFLKEWPTSEYARIARKRCRELKGSSRIVWLSVVFWFLGSVAVTLISANMLLDSTLLVSYMDTDGNNRLVTGLILGTTVSTITASVLMWRLRMGMSEALAYVLGSTVILLCGIAFIYNYKRSFSIFKTQEALTLIAVGLLYVVMLVIFFIRRRERQASEYARIARRLRELRGSSRIGWLIVLSWFLGEEPLSFREARDLVEQNRLDERLGLLAWAFSKMGLWDALVLIADHAGE